MRPTASEAAKLESLRRVLIYHNLEDVFEVKVIDLPQAAAVLHARSIVLVSRPVLRRMERCLSSAAEPSSSEAAPQTIEAPPR